MKKLIRGERDRNGSPPRLGQDGECAVTRTNGPFGHVVIIYE